MDKNSIRAAQIIAELKAIDELSQSPRTQREALLGDTTYLTTLNNQAATLRAELNS